MEKFLDYLLNKLSEVLPQMTKNERIKLFVRVFILAIFIIQLVIINRQYIAIQSYKHIIIGREERLESFLNQLEDDLTIIKCFIEGDNHEKTRTEIIKEIDKYFTDRRIKRQK